MTTPRAELTNAYEGIEASFADRAALEAYRATMLARSAEQADLLAPRLDCSSVFEVGCGNGRLLIELARRGVLSSGSGIDVARSRVDFAQCWAADLGMRSLRFEVADACEVSLPDRAFDAVVCITGTFAYFEAIQPGIAPDLLTRWARALRPGGLLVLELYPHPELLPVLEAAGGSVRMWRELDPDDPWRFYLSDLHIADGILVHEKTFVHRTSGRVDAGRRERLKLYSAVEVRALLTDAGFAEISCHEGWTSTPYSRAESMVVIARRPPGSRFGHQSP